MSQDIAQNTSVVDFHLDASAHPKGSSVVASWSVRFPHTSFSVLVETVSSLPAGEPMGFMSDIQRLMVAQMKAWADERGA